MSIPSESSVSDSPVFISYASPDRERALRVADDLEDAGLRVWLDQRSIPSGSNWDAEIVRALTRSAAVLLVVTPASVNSHNVVQELRVAWEERRPIVPLVVEETNYPDEVRYLVAGRQWVDLRAGDDHQWVEKLLGGLSAVGVRPGAAPPTNLPPATDRLLGRERESAIARKMLQSNRLVTFTGVGGTGKTSLATAVAWRTLRRFPGGVFLVDLSTLTEAEAVVPTISRVLNITEAAGRPLRDQLVARLQDVKTLIVLDNFEQVVDAASSIADLLRECPLLSIVVTSRIPLRLAAEQELPLAPLTAPDTSGVSSLSALSGNPAVQLFVERAQKVRPEFTLTADNARVVAEVCVRLDCLPLAIELAAARMRVLPLAALRARLHERLTLLTVGARDAPERQRTLRAAIQWSYDLLSEPEKRIFDSLSVFAGGCSLQAAESVCPTTEIPVFDVLASLVEQSLVRQVSSSDGEPRFWVLETLREYGAEKLATGAEQTAVLERHTTFFAALSEEAAAALADRPQPGWQDRLERDHDNIRTALRRLDGSEDSGAAVGLRMATALWWFWHVRGHFTDGRRWLRAFLARAVQAPPRDRAAALLGLGSLALRQSDLAEARARLEEASTLAREADDPALEATILNVLGVVASNQHDETTALISYERSLDLNRRIGNDHGTAKTLINVGVIAHNAGDLSRARQFYLDAEGLLRRLGDQGDLAIVTLNLAGLAVADGDYAAGGRGYREALLLSHDLGHTYVVPTALEGLAGVAGGLADGVRGATLLGAAAALRAELALPVPEEGSQDYQHALALVRTALPDPSRFDAAWEEGTRMSLDHAVALAASGANST